MIITVERVSLPSWNDLYEGGHWGKRKKLADEWHQAVGEAMLVQKIRKVPLQFPVSIVVRSYYKNLKIIPDADNVCAKLAIDALKDWVLVDDSPRYVLSVTTMPFLDRENPRVEIEIIELPEGQQSAIMLDRR